MGHDLNAICLLDSSWLCSNSVLLGLHAQCMSTFLKDEIAQEVLVLGQPGEGCCNCSF